MKQTIIYLALLAVLSALAPAGATGGQDRALFISPEYAATQIQKSSKMLLVDVRPKSAFEKIHITGSIHIPAHFLKTKAYLKQKMVVLVNNGFCKQHLIQTCTDLNEKGFDARILSGGLMAWIQKDLPSKGDAAARKALSRVSPREALQEHTARSFLPVMISEKQAKPVFEKTVRVNPTDPDFLKLLSRYNQNKPNGSILIYSPAGSGYAAIREQLTAAGIENGFFLSGGLAAYKTFLDSRERTRAPRSQRLKTVHKTPCQNCND